MRQLADLDREVRAVCLGARTRVTPAAAADLKVLVEGRLDWDRMWDLGNRHDVLPLLAESLPAAAGAAVPRDWLERATRRRHMTLAQNARMADALGLVLDRFEAAGVPAIPVKGLVVAESLYGSLAARGAADLDVLVRPADLPAGREVLVELGYRQRPEPTFTALVHEYHDPPWYVGSGNEAVRLELHWDLWADRFFRSDAIGRWERAVPGTLLGRPVRLLTLEDMLIHLAIHRSRSALRLRWVCDIAELVRGHGTEVDWAAVEERADRIGARTAIWMVLSMADRFLGASPPPGHAGPLPDPTREARAPRADLWRRRDLPGRSAGQDRPDAPPHAARLRAGRRRPDRPGARLEPAPVDPPDPPRRRHPPGPPQARLRPGRPSVGPAPPGRAGGCPAERGPGLRPPRARRRPVTPARGRAPGRPIRSARTTTRARSRRPGAGRPGRGSRAGRAWRARRGCTS